MKKSIYLLLAASIFLGSCASKIPFTTKEQAKYRLSDTDVKRLQFYTQGDIVMKTSVVNDKSTKTENGELVIKNESSENTVYIESGTEGIAEKIENGILYMSFENGKNLQFKSYSDGKYRIVKDKINVRTGEAKVTYGGKSYQVSRNSLHTILMFKLKRSVKNKSKQRSVGGRTL